MADYTSLVFMFVEDHPDMRQHVRMRTMPDGETEILLNAETLRTFIAWVQERGLGGSKTINSLLAAIERAEGREPPQLIRWTLKHET
jgi:hypothetical protein